MRSRSGTALLIITVVLGSLLGWCLLIAAAEPSRTGPARARPRVLGIELGQLPPGPLNAITDVAGVRVGHATLIEGESLRTGVTVILPHADNPFTSKVPAAIHVANGFGKLTGVTQVRELGTLETPIALTGTLSVWRVADALAEWVLDLPGNESVRSINPVVGECNDGYLSDIRRRPVGREQLRQALKDARGGPVAEGCVGAGTGTRCLGFKGGIGTASRVLPRRLGGWTVGVLVQTNFGGTLTIAGVPIGAELGRAVFSGPAGPAPTPVPISAEQGSCMVVVATDAPVDARQLERMASRAPMGLARTGAFASNGSGDYTIAFTASPDCRIEAADQSPLTLPRLGDHELSPLFLAVVEATEEAVLSSIFMAATMTGHEGRTVEALPVAPVLDTLRRRGVIAP